MRGPEITGLRKRANGPARFRRDFLGKASRVEPRGKTTGRCLSPPRLTWQRSLRAQKAKHSVNILLSGGALSPPHTTHPCVCGCMCASVCARLFVCECVSQVSAKKAGAFE